MRQRSCGLDFIAADIKGLECREGLSDWVSLACIVGSAASDRRRFQVRRE